MKHIVGLKVRSQ